MMPPPRTDKSSFAQWWRNLDRVSLLIILLIMGIGYILILAASPAVAQRIGASSRFFFISHQIIFLFLSIIVILIISRLSVKQIRALAIMGGLLALGATIMTLFHGMEIKGARRWISLPIMSVQPSEFLKPCFAVITAWLLSMSPKEMKKNLPFSGKYMPKIMAFSLFLFIALLLQAQPDIGMLSVISIVFLTQLFTNGLAWKYFIALALCFLSAFGAAYFIFPHVRSRIERFLHPNLGDHYQIDTSLRAFAHGGFLGCGPGEGHIKDLLPDAHADFIFSVAGEEYGFILCAFIILLFLALILRNLLRLFTEEDPFILLAVTGLITGFGLQAAINMGSSLHLIPTKGMTLPFISYGGSSALALSLAIGMLLALTRRRIEGGIYSSPLPQKHIISSQNKLSHSHSTSPLLSSLSEKDHSA